MKLRVADYAFGGPVKVLFFFILIATIPSAYWFPPISRTIGQKYQDREIVARGSKGPNPGFGHTLVKSSIWSHAGQRDRFVIFGHGAPKMGKQSWRETFGTIIVKVRILSKSEFWKFDPRSHHKRTEPRFWSHAGQKHHLVARRSKRPNWNFRPWGGQNGKKSWGETLHTTGVKFRSEILSPGQYFIFWPIPALWLRSATLALRNFASVVAKVLATILYSFLGWKYQIVIFGRRAAKMCRKSQSKTQNTLSRWKIWKFDQSGRNSKHPIPHSGCTPVRKIDS